ncbi:uncharacterized protein DDB_G0292642-like isoform X1 [Mugil cephalus]|uniref:uncharacterized protein DDB_G0292642-like isoform X1 n=2 Tax=Mugil cephalus TaxID=48193 RepID=UPI001FB73282|nr:uncharacterized protein DDB_G0292642-like isoform X1 [Mugil cephalus]
MSIQTGARPYSSYHTNSQNATERCFRNLCRNQSIEMDSNKFPEKCYDPRDPTLRFVDGEDDLDFLCEGFKSPRALMSCGHAVTPMSLTKWCDTLLKQGKSRFVCGQPNCNVEWSFKEVCKMALLTPEEKKYFKEILALNYFRENIETKPCPGCTSSVVRAKGSNLLVCCTVCTATRRQPYDFCWQCLREWKGPRTRSDRCDNDGCCNLSLETLKTCPDVVISGVAGCPSIRACPTCGSLLEHTKLHCNNVVCPRCSVEFCFVCLETSDECDMDCLCAVAPRQTSIPVWKRK